MSIPRYSLFDKLNTIEDLQEFIDSSLARQNIETFTDLLNFRNWNIEQAMFKRDRLIWERDSGVQTINLTHEQYKQKYGKLPHE